MAAISTHNLTQQPGAPTTQQPGAPTATLTSQKEDKGALMHPFNNPSLPPIPARLLKTIKSGGYIDLDNLLPEALSEAFDLTTHKGSKEEQAKRQFNISANLEWELAFATYTAAVTHGTPEKVHQLIVYSGIIFLLAREAEGPTWLCYDKEFHQAAAITPTMCLDQQQPDVWLACLASPCPTGKSPNKEAISSTAGPPPAKRASNTAEACHRLNRGECFVHMNTYTHVNTYMVYAIGSDTDTYNTCTHTYVCMYANGSHFAYHPELVRINKWLV